MIAVGERVLRTERGAQPREARASARPEGPRAERERMALEVLNTSTLRRLIIQGAMIAKARGRAGFDLTKRR